VNGVEPAGQFSAQAGNFCRFDFKTCFFDHSQDSACIAIGKGIRLDHGKGTICSHFVDIQNFGFVAFLNRAQKSGYFAVRARRKENSFWNMRFRMDVRGPFFTKSSGPCRAGNPGIWL
jgi:hypothetical protein